ncbi:MAG: DNA polymerase III subunit delta' [Desulfovibrionaceae bacterium]|nr:DNA polymerase III subunit delta' [Desulfovibrionaceae bacterium]
MARESVSKIAPPQQLSPEEARRAFDPAFAPGMERVRGILAPLADTPPQVLLLEGGSEGERAALARWWAALLNCPARREGGAPQNAAGDLPGPCLHCPDCLQIGAGAHPDVHAFDGRISNKDDEENPGPVRAFNMENVRTLKSRLGDAPHGAGRRVVILDGLSLTRDEAANALLKALEEPSATTVFVLLAPQREQLLPTLVSRSWTLTLPWPATDAVDPALTPWLDALAGFLTHGRGWLTLTAAKGAVDPALARHVLLACEKSLAAALSGAPRRHALPTTGYFAALSDAGRAAAGEVLAGAQEALLCNVNPARVLDWTATRLYSLSRD